MSELPLLASRYNPRDIKALHAHESHGLVPQIQGRHVLSAAELVHARVQAVHDGLWNHGKQLFEPLRQGLFPDNFPNQRAVDDARFETAITIMRAIRDEPLWQRRITTSTHGVRVGNRYAFFELQPSEEIYQGTIIDGGRAYPKGLWDGPDTRWITKAAYDAQPGGCYTVGSWFSHPVLRAVIGDINAIIHYSWVLWIISYGRVGSP